MYWSTAVFSAILLALSLLALYLASTSSNRGERLFMFLLSLGTNFIGTMGCVYVVYKVYG